MSEPILRIRNLDKYFSERSGLFSAAKPPIQAVSKVSLDVFKGDSLGIVGESGCGKSTLARTIMGITPATSGEILYRGEDIALLKGAALRELYKHIQFVFQDPTSSLNPRKTVRQILQAPMIDLLGLGPHEREERAVELMEKVNMRPEFLDRHPHEFSGGQAQRIGMARALATNPEVLILDEPVSALDVSIQAQILELLRALKDDLGLTYLFISHDLAVVDYLCDRVAVMYLGQVMEEGRANQIFEKPRHPYTNVLLASVPHPDEHSTTSIRLSGELPNPAAPPPGCPFEPRCYRATAECSVTKPVLTDYGDGHKAACFYADNPVPPQEEDTSRAVGNA